MLVLGEFHIKSKTDLTRVLVGRAGWFYHWNSDVSDNYLSILGNGIGLSPCIENITSNYAGARKTSLDFMMVVSIIFFHQLMTFFWRSGN